MSLHCTRCEGTGFLNLEQVYEDVLATYDDRGDSQIIIDWISGNKNHDVQVCDCCGDGYGWHGYPGEHYNNEDPPGKDGPYAYNGGLCECH